MKSNFKLNYIILMEFFYFKYFKFTLYLLLIARFFNIILYLN